MVKKTFLLGVVLLIAGQLFAQESSLITLSADGSETVYAMSDVQKIVFKSNTMTVNMKSGADATDITCIRFLSTNQSVKSLTLESSVFVFPNPVKTQLTVAGVGKDVKINLFNLNGTFLQSIPAQDNIIEIDVSSLQQGLYLLRIGDQVVKFVKQ